MLLWIPSMKEQHIVQDLFVVGGFMKEIAKNRNEIKQNKKETDCYIAKKEKVFFLVPSR